MIKIKQHIPDSQRQFYLKKFEEHGRNVLALSWNDKQSQELRFKKLSTLFQYEKVQNFSVHDVGCGLAHLFPFLKQHYPKIRYSGSDLLEEFIQDDRRRFPEKKFFIEDIGKDEKLIDKNIKNSDYYFASGLFYTKEKNSIHNWEEFILQSLHNMYSFSRKGIAVNFLTRRSEYYSDRLYYADPIKIARVISSEFSRFFSILHDLPLYEFTVLIYKDKFINESFSKFKRYFKS